jgi:hypothetical protein
MNLKDKLRGISQINETVVEATPANPQITTEKAPNAEPKEQPKGGTNNKGLSQRVKNLLSNELFNDAEVAKHVFGKKGGTQRSLFRKKLNNIEGHEFTDEELSKIVNFMRTSSKEIDKHLGTKKIE